MTRFLPATLACLLAAGTAHAVPKVFKHDQFDADIAKAAQQVSGISLATQPGFAAGEAFGQLYKPFPADYPVKIQGLDMILAAPPNAQTLTTHAQIELWYDSATGAAPAKSEPDFVISTTDLISPQGQTGMPLQGNVAWTVDFDWNSEAGHPPIVTEGNVRVVVRYTQAAADMQSEWGTYQCSQSMGMCGCQRVGVLLDQTTTPGANLMSIISPLGQCSGEGRSWMFMEAAGVTGDVILRMRADVTGTCTPNCTGRACGSDGCGGLCGECPSGKTCDAAGQCTAGTCVPECGAKQCGEDGCGGSCGQCPDGFACDVGICAAVAAPAITAIIPASGFDDEITPVQVSGSGFQAGLVARIGAVPLQNVGFSNAGLFLATVPTGLAAGTYAIGVTNPDGGAALLEGAFTVKSRAAEEATADVPAAGETAGDEGPVATADPGTGGGTSGGGCNAGAVPSAPALLSLALLGLGLSRRRSSR
jgi:uncharacterized protein (TIGR03382 family)